MLYFVNVGVNLEKSRTLVQVPRNAPLRRVLPQCLPCEVKLQHDWILMTTDARLRLIDDTATAHTDPEVLIYRSEGERTETLKQRPPGGSYRGRNALTSVSGERATPSLPVRAWRAIFDLRF